MLVAEELDVALSRVRIEPAGADMIYGNVATFVATLPFHPSESEGEHRPVTVRVGQWLVGKLARELGINVTGGSSSMADAGDVLRLAAATARASLLGAAALQWRLPVAELSVRDGVISHPAGKLVRYAELAELAAATPPGKVLLKARTDWRLIGRPVQRLDLPARVNGLAQFGLDVRRPGMLFASVRLCPMLDGSPGSSHCDAAFAMPGGERLVRLAA